MKPIHLYIIVLMATFTLTACDKSDDNTPKQQQEQPAPSPENPEGGGDTPGGEDTPSGGDTPGGEDKKDGIEDIHNEETDQPAYSKSYIDFN